MSRTYPVPLKERELYGLPAQHLFNQQGTIPKQERTGYAARSNKGKHNHTKGISETFSGS